MFLYLKIHESDEIVKGWVKMVKDLKTKEVKGGIEEITREIEKILDRFQEIEFAYLFGSFLEREVKFFLKYKLRWV